MTVSRLRPERVRLTIALLLFFQSLDQLLIHHAELRNEVGSRDIQLTAVQARGVVTLERCVKLAQHILALSRSLEDSDVLGSE